ncbi:MAG TPA: hypothetical protein VNL16_06860 [Chloroflexota bacterium]|nr:hypothetical protein [Chloroflexota bacterium]
MFGSILHTLCRPPRRPTVRDRFPDSDALLTYLARVYCVATGRPVVGVERARVSRLVDLIWRAWKDQPADDLPRLAGAMEAKLRGIEVES